MRGYRGERRLLLGAAERRLESRRQRAGRRPTGDRTHSGARRRAVAGYSFTITLGDGSAPPLPQSSGWPSGVGSTIKPVVSASPISVPMISACPSATPRTRAESLSAGVTTALVPL